MKTYVITFEVVLKDTANLHNDDFIERAINEQLEDGEFIDSYDLTELTDKHTYDTTLEYQL